MSTFRRYGAFLSKLWLPRPSALKPMAFMSSIVGVSPKKFEIGELRQVAVLAEELAERDSRAGRRGVELVWRTEHDDDVSAPVRMERVGAVDVSQLLLLHDPEDDLLARIDRVGQVLEGGDDL